MVFGVGVVGLINVCRGCGWKFVEVLSFNTL